MVMMTKTQWVVCMVVLLAAASVGETVHRYSEDCETHEVTQIPIGVGDTLPSTTVSSYSHGKVRLIRTPRLFGRKRVVLFSLSGAFEPGAETQFRGMMESVYSVYHKFGLDGIVAIMPTDPHANDAFTRHHHLAPSYDVWTTVSDANGSLGRKLGLVCPHFDEGMRPGLHHFVAVVDNGVVEWIRIDPGDQIHDQTKPDILVDYLKSHEKYNPRA